jgi:hypothetical protein
VAVSRHGDSPIKAETSQKVTQTPYTTPVDVNGPPDWDDIAADLRRRADALEATAQNP